MSKFIVTLDPGHGPRYNPGVVPPYYEGDRMFALATQLKDRLEKTGIFTVYLTRSSVNDDPTMANRSKFAIAKGSDIFLSLHTNAPGSKEQWAYAAGSLIFYSCKRPDSKVFGKQLTDAVVKAVKPSVPATYSRGATVQYYPNTNNLDYFAVIRESVESSKIKYAYLLETLFHTHTGECTWLNSDANIKKLAETLSDCFYAYFKNASPGKPVDPGIPDLPSVDTGLSKGDAYTVYNTIPGYTNAADALAGKNAKSNVLKGSYKVFNTTNTGAINVTSDQTATKPGSWINPANNKIPAPAVETYEALVPIDRYNSSANAIKQVSSLGKYNPGMYFVYKKVEGSINITSDKTGKVAGSWINPKQNVKPVAPPPDPKPEEKPDDVLDTSKLHLLTMDGTNVPVITFAQAVAYVKKKNPAYKLTAELEEVVYQFIRAGFRENIRWDFAFCQSMVETAVFKYGNQVKWDQNNYAGIGATNGGASGGVFQTPYVGALAQMQHLKAYANTEDCVSDLVDPRFKYVTRGWAPYIEWLGMKDNPKNELYNKQLGWAVPGLGYGAAILKVYNEMKSL